MLANLDIYLKMFQLLFLLANKIFCLLHKSVQWIQFFPQFLHFIWTQFLSTDRTKNGNTFLFNQSLCIMLRIIKILQQCNGYLTLRMSLNWSFMFVYRLTCNWQVQHAFYRRYLVIYVITEIRELSHFPLRRGTLWTKRKCRLFWGFNGFNGDLNSASVSYHPPTNPKTPPKNK